MSKPTEYDGSDWDSFIYQVILYFSEHERKFPKDQSKIIFTLSYMTKGTAKSWADHIRKEALFNPIEKKIRSAPVFGTWEAFLTKATSRFGNPNAQTDADRKLHELRQGSKSAQQFFQEFDELSTQAGYLGKEFELPRINLIKLHADNELVLEILKITPAPTEYKRWKELMIAIDNQQ